MKNLKKVLALVLVIASLMGMATMASATTSDDYSDADSITHIEAVDVMSTIGVFDGISGAFSGDSILTREQAAKIITYMILGKDDADALVASVAPYTDVSRDRWSAGSIAYCKNEGILAGVGNGRFEPDGKLTGVAFAKMCLVALGYDPEIQNLTGSQWAVNTSKLAIADAGITDNLSQISLADEMSREDACQMAFNTLQADMVDYDDRGGSFTVNGANISMSASKAKPVSKDTGWADTERADGNIGGVDRIQQFAEKYFTKLECWDDNDSFGRPATTWKYKSDEIGTYVDNSQLVQSWTAKAPKGEMHSAIGGSIVSNLNDPKRDGYVLKAYVDGQYRVEQDTDVFFVKNSSAAAGKTVNRGDNIGVSGNGVLTELYMDDNDNVTVVMINTYLVKASSDYNTVNQRVNVEPMDIDNGNVSTGFLPTSISNDDFDVAGVKDGDYLLVTVSYDGSGNKYSLESVTPATLQTGTVTEYTVEDSVVMGGTKYSYNKILGDVEKGESFSINSDATLVLDTYGYIMYVDDAMVSNDFVYIDDFGGTSGLGTKAVADAYFTDGTNSEITVGKVDGVKNKTLIAQTYGFSSTSGKNKTTAADHQYTHWYTYSASSGGEYTLSIPSDKRYYKPNSAIATDGGYDLVKNNTVRFMNGANGKLNPYSTDADTGALYANVMGNEKTIFVVKDDAGDVSTYTGVANVPTVTLDAGNSGVAKVSWISKKSDGYASFVFVDVSSANATVDGGNNIADYLFILKSTGKRTYVDGLDYYKYDVVIDGKEEERWISTALLTSNNPADDVGNLFYNIKEDSDGRITSGTQVETANSKKTHYNATMNGTSHTITQSGNSLHILADQKLTDSSYSQEADTFISDLFATGKSNINLVIGNEKGKNVDDLLYDTGADYETHLGVSASYINGMLRDYYLSGNVFVVVDDDDNDVIDTMWIYVNNIEKISS